MQISRGKKLRKKLPCVRKSAYRLQCFALNPRYFGQYLLNDQIERLKSEGRKQFLMKLPF